MVVGAMARLGWVVLVVAVVAGVVFLKARRGPAEQAAAPASSHELGTVAYACQPAEQSGCSAGDKCDLFCGAQGPQFACRKDEGTIAAGQACDARVESGVKTCARGTACLGGVDGPVCTRLCAVDADCAGSKKCAAATAFIVCRADPAKSKPFAVHVCR
jgi:hypothetical protein